MPIGNSGRRGPIGRAGRGSTGQDALMPDLDLPRGLYPTPEEGEAEVLRYTRVNNGVETPQDGEYLISETGAEDIRFTLTDAPVACTKIRVRGRIRSDGNWGCLFSPVNLSGTMVSSNHTPASPDTWENFLSSITPLAYNVAALEDAQVWIRSNAGSQGSYVHLSEVELLLLDGDDEIIGVMVPDGLQTVDADDAWVPNT